MMLARSRGATAFAVTLMACASGCAPGRGAPGEPTATVDSALDATSLGTIASGQTLTSPYTSPPLYRAYSFHAWPGDAIAVDVHSDRDAVAWITDPSYASLAFNDDASPATRDAHVVYTAPRAGGAGARASSRCDYEIVFREFGRLPATFDVTLSIEPPKCDPENEPWRTYLGTPAECATLHYTCPPGKHSFSNECGCGCEPD
jgi:hypothetical protein